MDNSWAELVFMSGPQHGERAVLQNQSVLVGRNPQCDIQILEDTVSREQLRFTLEAEGWIVENLSAHPIRINGKKYKSHNPVILDTGDVVDIGRETTLLFVDACDDADVAFIDYKRSIGEALDIELNQGGGAVATMQQGEIGTSADTPTRALPDQRELSPDETKIARKKKLLIGFCIYAVVMVAVIIVIAVVRGGKSLGPDRSAPVRLTENQIRSALTQDAITVAGKLGLQPAEAARSLTRALRFHEQDLGDGGNLYRAIKHFRLHLAYSGSHALADPNHGRMLLDDENALIERVTEKYTSAWIDEQSLNWSRALARFESIQRDLPVTEQPFPETANTVFDNVIKHIMYVRKRMPKKRR